MSKSQANLIWKQKAKTINLLPAPFESEADFEKLIFETKEILEDIFPLKRQVRGGQKTGIPDVIGVDANGNICIIELKNIRVDAGVIPQVLGYAFWAQENPDSVKNLWNESKDKPEEIEIDWDNFKVRIVIVAPSFDKSTHNLVSKIGYQVDLLEVQQWTHRDQQFLLVDRIDPEDSKRIRVIKGLEEYGLAFYESNRNKESARQFVRISEDTARFVRKNGMDLERKFNKHYCGYKLGNFNAFGIKWIGTKSFAFFFKLPESVAKRTQPRSLTMHRYEDIWKEAIYVIDPKNPRIKDYLPLMRKSFELLTGEQINKKAA